MTQGSVVEQVREAIPAARTAITALQRHLWQAHGPELSELVELLDDLGVAARAAMIALTAEAIQRGEISGSQHAGAVPWLRAYAPSLRQGGVKPVADIAAVIATQHGRGLTPVDPMVALWQPHTDTAGAGDADGADTNDTNADASDASGGEGEPGSATQIVCAAVLTGQVAAPVALTVLSEIDRLRSRLQPAAVPTVTSGMLDLGQAWGPTHVRRLRSHLLARFGLPGELQADHDTLARHVCLSTPHVEDGLTSYRLTLDPVSAATLEAAIGPLSAPAPNPDSGDRDLRPAGQRRAQALIDLCRRATTTSGITPAGVKTTLMVTIPLADLQHGLTGAGAGAVVGTPAAGTLLPAGTLRRMACDAGIIPTVLGSDSQILDLGRTVRFFTPAQTTALWVRDRGCTFPGCTAPAHWCDAHHITHWLDGGATTLDNATLLCGRHHHIVHRDRLTATTRPPESPPGHTGTNSDPPHADGTTPPTITWDLTPGSYDHALRDRTQPAA